MEEFSFAKTPVPDNRVDTKLNTWDDQRWFNKWVETTETAGLPSPELLAKAQAQVTKLSAANLDVVEHSDRYEGHTADLLFTRWLETTEAVLSGMQSPGPAMASGAVTPATHSRYASTPSHDFLTQTDHPLSLLRQAADRACQGGAKKQAPLGGGWYEASPLAGVRAARAAFAQWRDTDGSEDQESRRGRHSRTSSVSEDEGSSAGKGLDDGTMAPLMQDLEMSTLGVEAGGDAMQISPLPNAASKTHWKTTQGPHDPTGQVLELMVSPAQQSRVMPHWPPREGPSNATAIHGVDTPALGQGEAASGVARDQEEEEGGMDMSVWGSGARESESESEEDVDLAGMGFTPLSATMSPGCMQELIGLMLTPGRPQPVLDFS